jgi:hypothetical protein
MRHAGERVHACFFEIAGEVGQAAGNVAPAKVAL